MNYIDYCDCEFICILKLYFIYLPTYLPTPSSNHSQITDTSIRIPQFATRDSGLKTRNSKLGTIQSSRLEIWEFDTKNIAGYNKVEWFVTSELSS